MKQRLSEELIYLRGIKEIKSGDCRYVTLGGGMPMRLLSLITDHDEILPNVVFHSENGILGHGFMVRDDSQMDSECINAGGFPVFLAPGTSICSQIDAFAMMRGGHIDLAFLGAYQVSEKGDMANWLEPGRDAGHIGGAMDLVVGAKRVVVLMRHNERNGKKRILKECNWALTGAGVVDRVITDLAVIDVGPNGLVLREVAPGFTAEEVQAMTEAKLEISSDLKDIEY